MICPNCKVKTKIYSFKKFNRYRCSKCKKDFTNKTGTIYSKSKLPIYILDLAYKNKELPSTQLARIIGVTQKTAYNLKRRLN